MTPTIGKRIQHGDDGAINNGVSVIWRNVCSRDANSSLSRVRKGVREAWGSEAFRTSLGLLKDYAGRPSPITECERISEDLVIKCFLNVKI